MKPAPYAPLRLHHAAAWYPDLWSEAVWAEDMVQMRAHGLTAARVGEFCWSRLEPREGSFDFGWLRRALDLAHASGIGVVLCTPTATPPLWVLKKHPDAPFLDRDGRPATHGGRQHASYSHPGFRACCAGIVARIAEEFGEHPALIAWQTDNEYRGHQPLDTSPAAAIAWTAWLRVRYGKIEALNEAWGTHMWSQWYQTFEEVPVARAPLTTGHHTYSLEADYRRFMSDEVVVFNRAQCDLIRAHSTRPITHNSIACTEEDALAADLDFISVDVYQPPDRLWDPLMHFDFMRGLGRRRGGFWVMETAPECLARVPFPRHWLRSLAFASWCSGGEGFSYWLWRQQRSGVEISHPCILHACGKPTLGAADVRQVGELRPRLEPLLREWRPALAEVALLRSDRHGRTLLDHGIGTFRGGFSWWEVMHTHHRALLAAGVWKDGLFDGDALDGYRMVFAIGLMACTPEFLENARRFVASGGVLVLGAHAGTRTVACTIPTNAIQGDLEKLFGFEAAHLSYLHETPVTLADGTRATGKYGMIAYLPQPGDEVMGVYDHPRFGGLAWGVSRAFGSGRVYALGSELDLAATTSLHTGIVDRHTVARHPQQPGVFVFPQRAADGSGSRAWAVVNSTEASAQITLPSSGSDLLGQRPVSATFELAAGEVAFVEAS